MWVGSSKIVMDFHGNISIKDKRKNMAELIEEVRRQFNTSCVELEDFEDFERCVLGVSLCAGTEKSVQLALSKVLEYIDTHSFARVVSEDPQVIQCD